MIESPDSLLDLTGYRHIAGFIIAMLLLQKDRGNGILNLKLRSLQDANWLASRLCKQGYSEVTVVAQSEQALLKIHKTV
jgi:hypothetical protein